MDACVIVPRYKEADNLEPLVAAIIALAAAEAGSGLREFYVLNVDEDSPEGIG